MLVKTSEGDIFNIEFISARYFNEKEEDVSKRLQRWDQIVKNKKDTDARPKFLF